jgi:hypothetical protein
MKRSLKNLIEGLNEVTEVAPQSTYKDYLIQRIFLGKPVHPSSNKPYRPLSESQLRKLKKLKIKTPFETKWCNGLITSSKFSDNQLKEIYITLLTYQLEPQLHKTLANLMSSSHEDIATKALYKQLLIELGSKAFPSIPIDEVIDPDLLKEDLLWLMGLYIYLNNNIPG